MLIAAFGGGPGMRRFPESSEFVPVRLRVWNVHVVRAVSGRDPAPNICDQNSPSVETECDVACARAMAKVVPDPDIGSNIVKTFPEASGI
jgi:hypothetical protein